MRYMHGEEERFFRFSKKKKEKKKTTCGPIAMFFDSVDKTSSYADLFFLSKKTWEDLTQYLVRNKWKDLTRIFSFFSSLGVSHAKCKFSKVVRVLLGVLVSNLDQQPKGTG